MYMFWTSIMMRYSKIILSVTVLLIKLFRTNTFQPIPRPCPFLPSLITSSQQQSHSCQHNNNSHLQHHTTTTFKISSSNRRQKNGRQYLLSLSSSSRHLFDESNSSQNKQTKKKKKKNKYANFSQTDKLSLDPFEQLLAETEAKRQTLNIPPLDYGKSQQQKTPPQQPPPPPRTRNKMTFPNTTSIIPSDPSTYGFVELGIIIGAHGVKGELKLTATTSFGPLRLCQPGIRHLRRPSRRSPREVFLKGGRSINNNQKKGGEETYLITLEGIEDRDEALRLKGSYLYAREEERGDVEGLMDEEEYLVSDLVGLEVFLLEVREDEGDDGEDDEGDDDGEGRFDDDADDDGDDPKLSASEYFVGHVAGVILGEDLSDVPGLGQDLLEIVLPRGLGQTPSWKDEMVLVPFVPEIVPIVDVKEGVIYVTPPEGLLDLTYIKKEKVRIKGFLPPAKDD